MIILLLLFASLANAQSVILKVLTSATAPIATSPIQNQGQTTHTLYVQYVNSGGTCFNTGGTIQVEASYDGTKYFGITSAPLRMSADSGTATGYVTVSSGPYPYLRVNQYDTLGTNCRVNAWYSGAAFSVDQPQMAQSITSQWRNSASFATPSSPATVLVAPASIDTSKRAVAYLLTISNKSADALLVTLQEETSAGGCDNVTVVNTFFQFNVPTLQTIVLPGSDIPWFTPSAVGNLICARLVSGGSINYAISTVYRLEQ